MVNMDDQKQRPKVLITNTGVCEEAIDLLRKYCDVVVNETPTRDAILSKVKGVDAIFVKKPVIIDKEVLDAAGSQLKVVSLVSRGIDSCDTDELKRRNIKLTHLHDENATAVANSAIMLLLAASRRYHECRLAIEQNAWERENRQWMMGYGLQKATVGIIGLGNIGQAILKRLIHFDVKRFLYTGPKEKKEGKELCAEFVSLNTLLEESDFVIMGCPLNNETNGMCNAEFFSKMKKKAVFVNVSRSGLVDQPALIQALKSGDIFAAGLDVMTPEPLPVDHELLKLPNIVLTPHVAFKTRDTMKHMGNSTALRLLRALNVQM
ncbi:glyoxylate reductase/hydroxypyruvate reductase-like isoform X2 [Diabrotica virgifera virgifera]|uniref:Glyoxylate reductase/hydroxypyruvate reductase n=1 Tax=Diabrotica virgifera virgifera TaxID=50390 RepID=A0A6P7GX74_DIAVI|nr:glyoxylate reductase/hydroxypyruvate reductase-like isoform X2 [Diabrotica virgifera virgifera]